MDEDLESMTREALEAEARRLRAGIRTHRDSSGHELCWHHPALWALLPERTDPLPTVPTWPEFLRGCLRYRQSLDDQLPEAPRSALPYDAREPIQLPPGDGRSYPMGRIHAVFKADGDETAGAYSISEWWLEPHTAGPGAHAHAEDDIFYVIEGAMSVLVGDRWVEASRGSFVLVPRGMTHDFQNRGSVRAGVLNVSVPGNFEKDMPAIAEWFAAHPPTDA